MNFRPTQLILAVCLPLILTISACAKPVARDKQNLPPKRKEKQNKVVHSPCVPASLIRLLANPDIYEGSLVCASGFLLNYEPGPTHGREGFIALYLSKDHADFWLNQYGVEIAPFAAEKNNSQKFADNRIANCYVELVGKFHVRKPNPHNFFAAELTEVRVVSRLEREK